ncbi:MAG: hypothetical protein NTW52_01965 [Planctomycetota bacterium]|nr:hypothetical protein [Planctomycetota bacterium]
MAVGSSQLSVMDWWGFARQANPTEPMALATGDARRLNVGMVGRFSGGNPELALTAQGPELRVTRGD